ncbi:hypothetical protein [Acetobacter sp. DsW_063]|uniref:hypothetical protein n=1 Tax=Acetobacter sp. DsW_063 TaxID=1514894 RepID=UPI000A381F25|nr:hypothetical protein [Acetobacter sp. DsW_063]OUJ10155.1 hypothetical protein HK28_06310 [Acetobacter sp. DsW_063]
MAAAQVVVACERNPWANPVVTAKIKPAFQTAHNQIEPLVDAARAGDPRNQAAIETVRADHARRRRGRLRFAQASEGGQGVRTGRSPANG